MEISEALRWAPAHRGDIVISHPLSGLYFRRHLRCATTGIHASARRVQCVCARACVCVSTSQPKHVPSHDGRRLEPRGVLYSGL